ncbi:MAG: ATP-binding protein [Saprospiraceae bacterium]
MNLFAKITFLILLASLTYAQQSDSYPDSLQKALNGTSNDTVRMEICSDLGSYYLLANHDSSLLYLEEALPIAVRLHLKLNEASILNTMGLVLMYNEKFSNSLESFLKAMNIAKDPGSEKITWHLSPDVSPTSARLSELSTSYDFIGLLNAFTGNWIDNIKNQLKNYREAEKYAITAHDTGKISLINLHMGIAYMNAGKLDSALILEKKALSMFSEQKDQRNIGVAMKYLGDIYVKMGDFESARYTILQATELLKKTNDYAHLGMAYNALSRTYMVIHKPDSALYYARVSLNIFEKLKESVGKREAYNLLASHFDQLHKTDSASVYLRLEKSLSDSLIEQERKNLLAFEDVVMGEEIRLEKLEKEKIETREKERKYALVSGIAVFMGIFFLLYRNNLNRKKANSILQQRNEKIENTLNQLKSTQTQLIQSEKMASLGVLTAGIAHEIQNPLNFVNNFSEVNTELIEELRGERLKVKGERNDIFEEEILKDISQNLEKINHHGKRADSIVKGMLQHSRSNGGVKEPTDINALCDEYLRLSFHGFRAKDKTFNATMKTEFDEMIGNINIVPLEIGRAILNLLNNAFYAVNERNVEAAKRKTGEVYAPTVTVITKKTGDKILISVKDNGSGIPDNIKDKIFQPFFTTKPSGQGTGLGLSLAYDIIKAHGGTLTVNSNYCPPGSIIQLNDSTVGSTFQILLPVQ